MQNDVEYIIFYAKDGSVCGRLPYHVQDQGIADRSLREKEHIHSILKKLSSISLSANGTAVRPGDQRRLNRIEREFTEWVDYVMGIPGAANEACTMFRPFSCMKSGIFWAENVVIAMNTASQKIVEQREV